MGYAEMHAASGSLASTPSASSDDLEGEKTPRRKKQCASLPRRGPGNVEVAGATVTMRSRRRGGSGARGDQQAARKAYVHGIRKPLLFDATTASPFAAFWAAQHSPLRRAADPVGTTIAASAAWRGLTDAERELWRSRTAGVQESPNLQRR